MENLQIILSVAGTALGLLITAVTFITKFIKNSKAKKAMESVVEIGNAVLPYIRQAETFLNYSGNEKKEYVLTKANQFALEHGMQFDAVAVGEKIEELVTLTKTVNARPKDKTIEPNKVSTPTTPIAASTQINTATTSSDSAEE
jgi:hypothetical protein